MFNTSSSAWLTAPLRLLATQRIPSDLVLLVVSFLLDLVVSNQKNSERRGTIEDYEGDEEPGRT